MKPIETLKKEHRLIEKVLASLDKYTEAIWRGDKVEQGDLRIFVQFIQEFADHCHHGKEEEILFSTMVENGFPGEQGPIAVMLAEHEEGRRLVGMLLEKSEKTEPWSEEDRRVIRESAMEYIRLLSHHIMKEDNILYPMAQSRLAPEVLEKIGERFDKFENEEMGSGQHEKFHALADQLCSTYK